jgi:outer membrane immunogenic protein
MEAVEAMPVAAPYSWTGFYLGAQVGYAFRNGDDDECFDGEADSFLDKGGAPGTPTIVDVECDDFDDLTLPANAPLGDGFLESDSEDEDGGILAGLHIGADYQMGNFVIGALLEGNWIDGDGSETSGSFDEDLYEFDGPPFLGTLPLGSVGTVDGVQVIEDNDLTPPGGAAEEEPVDPRTDYAYESGGIDWYGTLRARAGVALGRALIYGTGGFAFGETGESSYDITEWYTGRERNEAANLGAGALPANCTEAVVVGTTSPGAVCTYSDSEGGGTSWGWALGAGVDVLATNNFSIGLEYLFVNLDDSDDLDFTSLSGDTIEFEGADNDFHTVTLRASYRFGGGS